MDDDFDAIKRLCQAWADEAHCRPGRGIFAGDNHPLRWPTVINISAVRAVEGHAPGLLIVVPPSRILQALLSSAPDALINLMHAKLVFIGQGAAGKSSTLRSMLGQPFVADHVPTLGGTVQHLGRPQDRPGAAWVEKPCCSDLLRLKGDDLHSAELSRALASSTLSTRPVQDDEPHGSAARSSGNSRSQEDTQDVQRGGERGGGSGDTPSFRLLSDDVVLQDVQRAVLRQNDKDLLRVSAWDMGGQPVFYDLLQLLLTPRTTYLLCFDMTLLSAEAEASRARALAYIKTWLCTISLSSPDSSVLLVGTRKDLLSDRIKHEQLSEELLLATADIPDFQQRLVMPTDEGLCFIPISNREADTDPKVMLLRTLAMDTLRRSAEQTPLVTQSLVAVFDEVRARARSSGAKTVHVDDVLVVCDSLQVPRTQCPELLETLHSLGMLTYFRESPATQPVVLLDPQWILDAFSSIIGPVNPHALGLESHLGHSLADELFDLRENGILDTRLLPLLWPDGVYTPQQRECLFELFTANHLLLPLAPSPAANLNLGIPVAHRKLVVPALLPDAEGAVARNGLDALGAQVQFGEQYRGAYGGDDSCHWFIHFSLGDIQPVCNVDKLRRHGFLPDTILNRFACLLQSRYRSLVLPGTIRLYRTALTFYINAVRIDVGVIRDIHALHFHAHTSAAEPVIGLVGDVLATLQASLPRLHMATLVAHDATMLLDLRHVRNAVDTRTALVVGYVPVAYTTLQAAHKAALKRFGLQGYYDAMISYRQDANSEFVSHLYECLSRTILVSANRPIEVFYDRISLSPGLPLANFCKGVHRARVAIPVISQGAVLAIAQQHASDREINLLLEWMLMVALHDHPGSVLARVYPLIIGDALHNAHAVPTILTFARFQEAMEEILATEALRQPHVATVRKCRQVLQDMGHADLPFPQTAHEVLTRITGFLALPILEWPEVRGDGDYAAVVARCADRLRTVIDPVAAVEDRA